MKPTEVAAAAAWLDQYAAASEQIKSNADSMLVAAWAAFDAWYDTPAVMGMGRQMADLSRKAQQATTGLASEYVHQVMATVQTRGPAAGRARAPEVRNGADLVLVHTRPAEAFRKAIATGNTPEKALERATVRASGLVRTDLSLVERETEQTQMEALGAKLFRRVIRPELSESGSCGLCVAASDRIYTIRDLLPIHPPHCKCKTMPIIGSNDPGIRINEDDLKRLYEAAGSTSGDDLKRVRVTVNEHGELGPVLSRHGDEFRSKKDVPLQEDPARAARMLEATLPTLDSLEQRAAAGEDVAGALQYQRDLVAKLRRISAAHPAAA